MPVKQRSVTLDHDKALGLLNRAVSEFGEDYVYPLAGSQCTYFDERDGSPSCIIGQVLSYSGFTYDEVLTWNNESVESLLENGIIKVDQEATYSLLLTAQSKQDNGVSWGTAVRMAEAVYQAEAAEGSQPWVPNEL